MNFIKRVTSKLQQVISKQNKKIKPKKRQPINISKTIYFLVGIVICLLAVDYLMLSYNSSDPNSSAILAGGPKQLARWLTLAYIIVLSTAVYHFSMWRTAAEKIHNMPLFKSTEVQERICKVMDESYSNIGSRGYIIVCILSIIGIFISTVGLIVCKGDIPLSGGFTFFIISLCVFICPFTSITLPYCDLEWALYNKELLIKLKFTDNKANLQHIISYLHSSLIFGVSSISCFILAIVCIFNSEPFTSLPIYIEKVFLIVFPALIVGPRGIEKSIYSIKAYKSLIKEFNNIKYNHLKELESHDDLFSLYLYDKLLEKSVFSFRDKISLPAKVLASPAVMELLRSQIFDTNDLSTVINIILDTLA